MKEIYFSYTCTLFFFNIVTILDYTFFSVVLSVCLFRPWRKFPVGCWSICAQLPQLRHPMKNFSLLRSPLILGPTRSLTVPNLGWKEGLEPLWISGLSWRREFVHCNVALCCRDAKETCFFQAWFCGCVAWVIVSLHNTCRNSPSILLLEIPYKARHLHPKRWWTWLFMLME